MGKLRARLLSPSYQSQLEPLSLFLLQFGTVKYCGRDFGQHKKTDKANPEKIEVKRETKLRLL